MLTIPLLQLSLDAASDSSAVPAEVMVLQSPCLAQLLAKQIVPPFIPHQPACSHHCLFPAEVFVCLWASWNMDLVQVKANPTKTTSEPQSQHTKETGSLNRERQSSLSPAAPSYAK